jgi:hypothetical protein
MMMTFSIILVSIALYHKRKALNKRLGGDNDPVFKIGKNINSVGFHKYNELIDNSDDERNSKAKRKQNASSQLNINRYKSNDDSQANQKLLFAESDDDDQDDQIFIR